MYTVGEGLRCEGLLPVCSSPPLAHDDDDDNTRSHTKFLQSHSTKVMLPYLEEMGISEYDAFSATYHLQPSLIEVTGLLSVPWRLGTF